MNVAKIKKELQEKQAELLLAEQKLRENEENAILEYIDTLSPRQKLIANIIHGWGVRPGETVADNVVQLSRCRGNYLVCDYWGRWKLFTANKCVRFAKDVLSGRDNVDGVTIFDLQQNGREINLNYIVDVTLK